MTRSLHELKRLSRAETSIVGLGETQNVHLLLLYFSTVVFTSWICLTTLGWLGVIKALSMIEDRHSLASIPSAYEKEGLACETRIDRQVGMIGSIVQGEQRQDSGLYKNYVWQGEAQTSIICLKMEKPGCGAGNATLNKYFFVEHSFKPNSVITSTTSQCCARSGSPQMMPCMSLVLV